MPSISLKFSKWRNMYLHTFIAGHIKINHTAISTLNIICMQFRGISADRILEATESNGKLEAHARNSGS